MIAYGNMIRYDITLVDLTSNFFFLCTDMKVWCLIVTLSLSHLYPGSGVLLDCIDFWSMPSFSLLYIRIYSGWSSAWIFMKKGLIWEITDNYLSYDVASGSEIMPCNKIDKPLVVTDFRETLWRPQQRCVHNNIITLLRQKWDFKVIFMSYDK